MATNAASYNPIGEETGPVSGPPPALSKDTKDALTGAAESDPVGGHVAGKDAGSKVGKAEEGEKKVEDETKGKGV